MYSPVQTSITVPVIYNSDPSMVEQVIVSVRPAYSNLICEDLEWTVSASSGNIIVQITATPVNPCIIPATIISGMQITSYDDDGNGVIYTSTSVNMLVDESWVPKAVNACGPVMPNYVRNLPTVQRFAAITSLFSSLPQLTSIWGQSVTPLVDFYNSWYGGPTFATVDAKGGQYINASCANVPSKLYTLQPPQGV